MGIGPLVLIRDSFDIVQTATIEGKIWETARNGSYGNQSAMHFLNAIDDNVIDRSAGY